MLIWRQSFYFDWYSFIAEARRDFNAQLQPEGDVGGCLPQHMTIAASQLELVVGAVVEFLA